jgi:HK97 family phage major capsid protein
MRAMVLGPRTAEEKRALSEGTDSAGGFTVPDILSTQLIDRMRARTVTIQAGAQTVPLSSDVTNIARLVADPQAGWRNENAAVAESDPTFDRIQFNARSLAVIVRASRELLEDSVNIDVALQNAFAGSMAVEMDRVALIGTGVAPQPRGISTTSGVGSFSMGVNGAALTNFDPFIDATQIMLDANAQMPTAAIMPPRTWAKIGKLKDTTNQPLVRPGIISDLPLLHTTSLPVNETQGTSNVASRIILGHYPELYIGVRSEMRVELLKERYADFLQYAFLVHLRADVALAHAASFSQVIGVL